MAKQIEPPERNPFEERADDIDIDSLGQWNVPHEFFDQIQKDLVGPGAKLFVGPRGCGKTHQIRLAHSQCRTERTRPLAVYVTFARYFWLEPRLGETSDARQVFQGWVVAKILESAAAEIGELEFENLHSAPLSIKEIRDFINAAEKGLEGASNIEQLKQLSIDAAKTVLVDCMKMKSRKRIVLLLDDAALTLTPEYLVEFFEIFRNLKSRLIAPKASVYPGTTEYGPRMHIGQDATEVPCWISIEDDSYLDFMRRLLDSRKPADAPEKEMSHATLDLLAYSAFGLPRTFLALYRDFHQSSGATVQQRINKILQERHQQLRQEYLSLKQKAPQYKTIIQSGWTFLEAAIRDLAKENKSIGKNGHQIILGIAKEQDMRKARMLQLLREVGLVFMLPDVKHGDREYWRMIPHILILISERGLQTGRGFSAAEIVARLAKGETPRHPLRRSFATLVPSLADDDFALDAPNCESCSSPRLAPDQKFCATCGSMLTRESAFRECMKIHLTGVGLPPRRMQRILDESEMRTIGDLLAQSAPATVLKQIGYISDKRTQDTFETVSKFVAEYLQR